MRNDAAGIDPRICHGAGVYFVVAKEDRPARRMVKVGVSSNMFSRMRQLKTHSPNPLILAHWCRLEDMQSARLVESIVHSHWMWARYRVQGEWFDMPRGHILRAIDICDALCDPGCSPQFPFPPNSSIVVTGGTHA